MSRENSRLRTPTSTPGSSRTTTPITLPYLPEGLILPDGPVGEDGPELLSEFFHHHQDGVVSVNTEDGHRTSQLPWWKRPSPWWLLGLLPFMSILTSATIAPRIEIYTMLVCKAHKPDILVRDPFGVDLFNTRWSENTLGFTASNHTLGDSYFSKSGSVSSTQLSELDSIFSKPNTCAQDPTVQAAVAKLIAIISACSGVLSCLTTGWWGSLSDRRGRIFVMGISVLGLLITDSNFIFVTLFSNHVLGGYWFLVVGPLIEGTLGGVNTSIAAIHAYMADTTTEGQRSRVFSTSLGLIFGGIALGPSVGGLIIRFTGQPLSVFYLSTCLHFVYGCFTWFIIPESLDNKHMSRSQAKYTEELHNGSRDRRSLSIRIKKLFGFLSPLAVFSPIGSGNPLKKGKKDWNLTLVALSYGVTVSLMGSYSFKFQYAAATFGWTSETLGYWLSLVGAARTVFLAIMLPILIKLFKPKPFVVEILREPSETDHLLTPTSGDIGTDYQTTNQRQTTRKEIHSPAFDLGLARASLIVEAISFTFMGLAFTPLGFTLFGMLGSMGAGFSPAMQSVTLSLYTRNGGVETGRLFGALSVIQSLSSQVLGPAVYGLIYMKTVASYPRTIFFVSVGSVVISLLFLSLVRLPNETHPPSDLEEIREPSETLVDLNGDMSTG